MTDTAPEMITIPAARLAALEAEIAALRAKVKKRNNNSIERLMAFKLANPEKAAENAARAAERSKKNKEKNRDVINARRRELRLQNRDAYNARRRELRRLKKEASAATPPPVDAPLTPGEGSAPI